MYSSSFIYLLEREREKERERERNKSKIFRVLSSVKWLELARFEHVFSCSSFSCYIWFDFHLSHLIVFAY